MRYVMTLIYVPDVQKTMDFYEKAFGLKKKTLYPGNIYGEMATGEIILGFASEDYMKKELNQIQLRSNRPINSPSSFELTFISENVQKDYQNALNSGAKAISAPHPTLWSKSVAYVTDINGIIVEIASQEMNPQSPQLTNLLDKK